MQGKFVSHLGRGTRAGIFQIGRPSVRPPSVGYGYMPMPQQAGLDMNQL
jgi:hypothetical protein